MENKIMKERPILFSAPMVRAILDGSKTQTRRIVKGMALEWLDGAKFNPEYVADPENNMCPQGNIGDRLWVREAFSVTSFHPSQDNSTEAGSDWECAACRVKYHADGIEHYINDLLTYNDSDINEEDQALRASKKKSAPSIHMPRWASRIQLDNVNVRVERLQDISRSDAEAEGLEKLEYRGETYWRNYSLTDEEAECSPMLESQIESFKTLWESINGAGSWNLNPWVWVIEFKRI